MRNSVRPFWTRVGLGFVQNSMGVYIIAQEFTSRDFKVEPLTETEIKVLKEDLINLIIEAT